MRRSYRIILFGVITISLVLIVRAVYVLLVFLMPSGGFQTSLDPAFVPTAEFLIQHPMPTPEFISYIKPEPGSTLDETTKVCVGVIPRDVPGVAMAKEQELSSEDFPDSDAAFETRIIVNKLALPRDSVENFLHGMMIFFRGRLWVHIETCTTPPLEKGLHLMEISMESSPRTFTYTWAYNVESNLTMSSED